MKSLPSITDKIIGREDLPGLIENIRNEKTIVFTNGCFDIIHPGHIHLLSNARKMGDVLIVGLNSDRSVRELKGQGRPVMKTSDRSLILASFSFVDFVVVFDEQTPLEIIKLTRPDVLVKGGDYKHNEIVGAGIVKKNGGKIATVPFLKGYSSSGYIDKI
ncbi:MAG: D-glycero-beta-D-manno-heptose 1-phosphate adenylyltransferase [Bacteroidales bacterium]|nr:D-glycero-beta-D-manno-heptose 1-phosphate adenylyltransferase [Bacteroidales bacterium]